MLSIEECRALIPNSDKMSDEEIAGLQKERIDNLSNEKMSYAHDYDPNDYFSQT